MTHRSETAIDPRFSDRERQPGLDLLRALAIIVVVIYHAALFGFKLPGRVDRFGWIGVDLFFVLSGYLIGGQLLAPLARDQRISLAGSSHAARCESCRPTSSCLLFIFCCRRGANIPRCRSRSGNFCCRCKTSRSMAEPLSHMPGLSRSRTNSILLYLFSCSFSFGVHARPSSS